MTVVAIFYTTIFYTSILLVLFLAFNVYKFIIKPYLLKRKYRKYHNVYMYPKAPPLVGDAIRYLQDMKAGKVNYHHQIQYALDLKGYDFRLSNMADKTYLNIYSLEATREFIQKSPKFIDRKSIARMSFGKMFPDSLVNLKSGANFQNRKVKFSKLLGSGYQNKYLGVLVEAIQTRVKELTFVEKVEYQDLSQELGTATVDA